MASVTMIPGRHRTDIPRAKGLEKKFPRQDGNMRPPAFGSMIRSLTRSPSSSRQNSDA